jgi:hypothetical protein
LNKATKTKLTKKQINEKFKKIREFVKPFSSDLKKSKKNIELLQIIFRLEPKSKGLELILKIIFDKNFPSSEVTDIQLRMLNKKLDTTMEKSEIMFKNDGTFYNVKIFKAYFELVTGATPKILKKLDNFEERLSIIPNKELRKNPPALQEEVKSALQSNSKKHERLLDMSHSLDLTTKEFSDFMDLREMIQLVIQRKFPSVMKVKKQTMKVKKQTVKQIAKKDKEFAIRMNTASEKINKQLLKILEMEETIKNKIEKISNLKYSCETCDQKISKTYQKKKLEDLTKEKKGFSNARIVLDGINSNFSRIEYRMNDGEYLPFSEAKQYVNMLMIKSVKEWHEYAVIKNKLPVNIPKYPNIEYSSTKNKEGWRSWSDWLGVKPQKYRSFKEAREFVRKLNIKTPKDWTKVINSGMLPADIPTNPQIVYSKNWKDYKRFF